MYGHGHLGTPFVSSNSNIGKQDKLVHKSAGISSESNGQNSASGEMGTVKRVAGGAVESGQTHSHGPQDVLRKS